MENELEKHEKEFRRDTEVITIQGNELLKTLYPHYLIGENQLESYIEKDSSSILNKFKYFRIKSCSVEKIGDEFDYLYQKMQKLFSAIHPLGLTVAYGVITIDGMANIVFGINNTENIEELIKKIISGLLLGIELEEIEPKFEKCINRYNGIFSAIPSCKIENEKQKFDISPLMRGLNGENYTLLFIATPVSENVVSKKMEDLIQIKDNCFAVSKRNIARQQGKTRTDTRTEGESENTSHTVGAYAGFFLVFGGGVSYSHNWSKGKNWSDSVSNAISNNETISGDVQNSFALELMEYAEEGIERFKLGKTCGMWKTVITYSSDSKLARNLIQSSLSGEIAKPNSKLLPAKSFSSDNISETLLIPKGMTDKEMENPLATYLSSAELSLICTLPTDSTPNFELINQRQYSLKLPDSNGETIEIGKVSDNGNIIDNMCFQMTEDDLNKHTFVCGITGSGKTTTVKNILSNCEKPFMVIEPAKKEYRNIELKNNTNVEVYTLGKPEINCLQMNPFYILPGISPQMHIDFLKDLFNASFSFYGPMPYILEKCLQNIYIKKGWNLVLGYHPYLINEKSFNNLFDIDKMNKKYSLSSHKFLFPTMYDLKCEVERYIEKELQYEGEVSGNIKSAIKTRLESLCSGAKGFMFNTNEFANMEKLLNENTVFELEGLADDSDKAFCVGLLIIFINEYRQIKKEEEGNRKLGLQHLLVIEEAHRLLKNIGTERISENMGNPKGKAVEHFTNMIAEMRSYGQGVIIAEQIPTKLAPDVIKNSSNKIIHRIVSYDDQEIIANTIGLSREDALYLGMLKTGFAVCHKEGMANPINVKVNYVHDKFISDSKLYGKEPEERKERINLSIIDSGLQDIIDEKSIKLLRTLMMCDTNIVIKSIRKIKEEIENSLISKNIKLIFPTLEELNKILSQKIVESVVKFLGNGIFSLNKTVSEELFNKIMESIKYPEEENVTELKKIMEKEYERRLKEKVKEILIQEIIYKITLENIAKIDIISSIKNFFVIITDKDIDEIIEKLKGEIKNGEIY